MATINVTDASATTNGAVGDGTTDDTQAIREHIAAANDGDDVYFPDPSDAYLVNVDDTASTTAQAIFPIDRDGTVTTGDGLALGNVANLELRGDGQGTIIRVGENDSSIHKLFDIHVRGGWNDLHFHDLEFDGDDANITGDGNAVELDDATDINATDSGVRFINIHGYGFDRNIWRSKTGGTVFDRVTGENVTTFNGIGHGGETGAGQITITNSLFINCGADGASGNGINCSGAALIEDTVMARNGVRASKVTPEVSADNVTYRRVRIDDHPTDGWSRTGGDPENAYTTTITFDDVIIENSGARAMDCAGTDDVDLKRVLLRDNNAAGNTNDHTRWSEDTTFINGGDTDLRIDGTNSGTNEPGARDDLNAGAGGNWNRYVWWNTDGAFVGTHPNITVDNLVNQDPAGIDTVPTESDVGAWSATTTTTPVSGLDVNGGSLTVRSGGSVGIGAPSAAVSIIDDWEDGDWGEYTNPNGTAWTTTTDSTAAFNGSVYGVATASDGGMESASGGGLDNYFPRGTPTSRIYVQNPGALSERLWIWYAIGTLLNDGYYVQVNFNNDRVDLVEEDGGAGTTLGTLDPAGFAADTWYEVEITWTSADEHTITVTNTSNDNQLGTIGPVTNANANLAGNSGIGFYGDGGNTNEIWVDYWHIP